MTDEEIADKYAEEYFGKKTELVEVWKLKSCKENFLAGLKAGRPQWHDLRKDPNDLPNTDRDVLVKREDEEPQVDNYYNDKEYTGWRTEQWDREYYKRKGDIGYPSSVIAWCEIPTFDKE